MKNSRRFRNINKEKKGKKNFATPRCFKKKRPTAAGGKGLRGGQNLRLEKLREGGIFKKCR